MRKFYLKKVPGARHRFVCRAEDHRQMMCWHNEGRICNDACVALFVMPSHLVCVALPTCTTTGEDQRIGELVPPPAPVEEGGSE